MAVKLPPVGVKPNVLQMEEAVAAAELQGMMAPTVTCVADVLARVQSDEKGTYAGGLGGSGGGEGGMGGDGGGTGGGGDGGK
jgi:hypothetical protein